MPSSSVCKYRDFATPWMKDWARRFQHEGMIHRKVWEWAVQSQVFLERGVLRPGSRGLGFAVGQEPLSSLFAAMGCQIDATDLFEGDVASQWASSGEHAAGLDALHHPKIVDRALFEAHVRFFPADMTDLSSLQPDQYDFLWSSCAMEHLGSLEKGTRFVLEAMKLLKVGGIACHTTEFNVSDRINTIETGGSVIYRESDLRQLAANLRRQFCAMEDMDFDPGDDPDDILYDSPPWGSLGQRHIKLELDGFVCTSAVLICRRYR